MSHVTESAPVENKRRAPRQRLARRGRASHGAGPPLRKRPRFSARLHLGSPGFGLESTSTTFSETMRCTPSGGRQSA